jgi:hypothetical protein
MIKNTGIVPKSTIDQVLLGMKLIDQAPKEVSMNYN